MYIRGNLECSAVLCVFCRIYHKMNIKYNIFITILHLVVLEEDGKDQLD